MKAMDLAHKLTRAHVVGSLISNYRNTFSEFLTHSHKVEKKVKERDAKYLITHYVAGNPAIVDIRDLPKYSASRDVIKVGVEDWAIRGNVRNRHGWNKESYQGKFLHCLNDQLGQWVNFADEYLELCLLLEFNGNLYRLTK